MSKLVGEFTRGEYKQRMKVSPSNADMQLRITLQNHNLTDYLTPLGTVILLTDPPMIVLAEDFTKDMADSGPFTVPDALFVRDVQARQILPVFLDGEKIHSRKGVKNRDDNIDKQLRNVGVEPLRFSYKGALGRRRLSEIVTVIKKRLLEALQH